ncbi:MAG: FIST signal transduction protein [Rhodospirillales bacterium]
MTAFRAAHGQADDWAHCAKLCADGLTPLPEGANLGFVYLTDELAEDTGSVLTYLRQKTGIEAWVGTIGLAVAGEGIEYSGCRAVTALVGAFPEGSFHLFPTLLDETEDMAPEVETWIVREKPTFAIVHGDPGNPALPLLLEETQAHLGGFLAGGLTASRQANHQICGQITSGGLSGVLFKTEVQVACGLSQGCRPIGESHEITEAQDNVVMALDGRPALEVFREDLGACEDGQKLAADMRLATGVIHAALPIQGSDMGDYTVRNLVGLDLSRGWVALGAEVEAGDRLLFVRRDPEAAEQDLRAMVDKVVRRAGPDIKAAHYVSCIARGGRMFGEPGRELAILREKLGDVPLVGFYAAGEISLNRLYGYTGVLTLFL